MALSRSREGGRLDISPGGRRPAAEVREPSRARVADEPKRARPRVDEEPETPRRKPASREAAPTAKAEPVRAKAKPSEAAAQATVSAKPAVAKPAVVRKPAVAAAKAEPDTSRSLKPETRKGAAASPAPAPPAQRRREPPIGDGYDRRPHRRRGSRLVRILFRTVATLALLGVIGAGAIIAYFAATLPPTAAWAVPERPPNVAILSERGELIANRGDTGGRTVTLDELPDHVPNAVIAIEDRRFYSHPGIDPIGLARAMVTNISAGSLVQGGSTISQQLAKNLFLDPSRTLERKIQEMIFAVWLEMKYSKDEILEMYLNRVYLGAGAYGVDAAARRYFGKGASDLSLPEAALLAGLLKAPTYYAPTTDLTRANARAATVVEAMRDAGLITDAEAAEARATPAELADGPVATSGGYVADWVADVLPGFAGNVKQDIVVETTIDLGLQELAQSALEETLAGEGIDMGVSQGAVVVMDAAGAVKALVGGKNYGESQFNRAVAAARQPGSAFKPFVYLAALRHGLTPDTMRVDGPTRIGNWSPENYTREYRGPVSLKTALALSLNTVAAQLAAEVGPASVVDSAHRMGIRSPLEPNASIALGTSEVTPLELTAAFVPFSNGGYGVLPFVIRRIRTADGDLLYERQGGDTSQVVDDALVGEMNEMMAAALTSGTAQRAQIAGWEAAGKTGTSQNWRDAWFVGYTAYFTAGVWMGNDDNSPTKRASGGTLPALLWKRLMEKVHEGMVPAELPGVDRIGQMIASGSDVPSDTPWDANAAAPAATVPVSSARDGRDWIMPAPQQAPQGGGFFRRLFGG